MNRLAGREEVRPAARTPTREGEPHPSASAPGRPPGAPRLASAPRLRRPRRGPPRPPEEGPAPRTSAARLQLPAAASPPCARASLTHLRPQRPPAPPAPARPPRAAAAAALASCPPPFTPRRAPAAAFPAAGGEGTRWVGRSGAGRGLALPPLGRSAGPCLRLRA